MVVKNAHANASTDTMNSTRMKFGVSWLLSTNPSTNHASIPTLIACQWVDRATEELGLSTYDWYKGNDLKQPP